MSFCLMEISVLSKRDFEECFFKTDFEKGLLTLVSDSL